MRRILPSVTTIGGLGSSWKEKIHELEELDIKECALFLTGLTPSERTDCFQELLKLRRNHEFSIPFCHAVSTMQEDEYRFLQDSFGTERFNLHPTNEFPLHFPLSDIIRSYIYIENNRFSLSLTKSDTEGFAGVCLDISHLFDMKMIHPEILSEMYTFLSRSRIGANHISGAKLSPYETDGRWCCSVHVADSPMDFTYLETFSSDLLSDLCAVEVENPLRSQLEYIQFIEALLSREVRKAA